MYNYMYVPKGLYFNIFFSQTYSKITISEETLKQVTVNSLIQIIQDRTNNIFIEEELRETILDIKLFLIKKKYASS